MKERPILFSAPMVRAILDGRKTQTRRIIKPKPIQNGFGPPDPVHDIPCYCDAYPPSAMLWPDERGGMLNGDAGHPWLGVDRLWVKEAHAFYSLNFNHAGCGNIGTWHPTDRDLCCHYREGCPIELAQRFDKWRPSIFMPRWASRITLEIVDVEAERLNAISEAGAIAEGIAQVPAGNVLRGDFAWENYQFKTAHPRHRITVTDEHHRILGYHDPRRSYASLWESINGPGGWAANPYVWVITFKRITP